MNLKEFELSLRIAKIDNILAFNDAEVKIKKQEIEVIGHDGRTKPITKDQAFFLLRNDIDRVENSLNRKIPWWKNLNEDRQYVLLDMCFQLGIEGLLKFKKMLSYMGVGNFEKAADECLDSKYAKQDTPARAKRSSDAIRTGVYKC